MISKTLIIIIKRNNKKKKSDNNKDGLIKQHNIVIDFELVRLSIEVNQKINKRDKENAESL